MRTKEKFERDTYILDLTKEASVFTMMAYAWFSDYLMATVGPIILLAVIFMFIPRFVIDDLFDKDETGIRKTKKRETPEWKVNLQRKLNITKFICLIVLTLYIFMNSVMMDIFGTFTLFMVCSFMVIPRKLINIMAEDSRETDEGEELI